MEEMRTLLYMFRGKLEVEQVKRFGATQRARQLIGCTQSTVYMVNKEGNLLSYIEHLWVRTENAPEEIKLAAMLV